MTLQEFQKRYDYNTATDELGKGGFGSVYKAYDRLEDRWVAIKIVKVEKDGENTSLMNEVETVKKLPKHANIAQYESCYRFNSPFGVFDHAIMQYYEVGNLSQLIKGQKLSFKEKEEIAAGVIAGIAHLHAHNIVHRDIKSSNILIAQRPDGTYNPKIVSKEFTDTAKSYFSNSFAGGSLLYLAPEQLKGGQIRKNVDLWSMGVMLFELFTGQVPFYPAKDDGTETARKEIIQKIEKAQIPDTIQQIPTPWGNLIRACLVVDSNLRIKDTDTVLQLIGRAPIMEEPTILEDLNQHEPKRTEPKLHTNRQTNTATETIIDEPTPPPVRTKTPTTTKRPAWLYPFIGSIAALVLLIMVISNIGGAEAYEEQVQQVEQQVQEVEQEVQQEIIEDGFEMVEIPSGTFQMGSNEYDGEKPIHSVTLSSFYMSKYEVTQKQWGEIMGTNPSNFTNCDNCPVENVSWNDIQDFIRKLNNKTGKNYRLPTEAEWEYAARGGQNYKYAGSDNIDNVAWYGSNSGSKTHAVGQKSANGYGLYDMTGNVWEWCSDLYGAYSSSSSTNPSGPSTGIDRVLRGGSWSCVASPCRVAARFTFGTYRNNPFGFRLVSQ
jgi:formylglycine-generating enzyme required for sulfatase activity/serine/threonine protein kinase